MRCGGERRGNSYDRRARRLWLLEAFGTGKTCRCAHCGKRLTAKTVTADRVTPGWAGGRYVRSNLVPACYSCNNRRYQADRKMRRTTYPLPDWTMIQFKKIVRSIWST